MSNNNNVFPYICADIYKIACGNDNSRQRYCDINLYNRPDIICSNVTVCLVLAYLTHNKIKQTNKNQLLQSYSFFTFTRKPISL